MITQKRRKSWPIWRPILIIFPVIIGLYFWQLHSQVKAKNRKELVTPVAVLASASPVESLSPTPMPTVSPAETDNLQKVVADSLEGTTGTYGVAVKNLKTGEHFELNGDHVFESGSLYKLWVMATVYEQEKSGNLQDGQVLSQDIATLNQEFQIDPEFAEQTEGTETYSVHDALYQMITISDNYTALLLTEKIGLSKVANFLDEYGFSESKVGVNGDAPTTTASDIELFMEKLYQGQIIDSNYSNQMLDLLKQQKLNTKIPQGLPTTLVIAHKTGELDSFTHDAAIIYTPSGDYILVVMSDSDDPQAAETRISDISQAIYGYFTKGG